MSKAFSIVFVLAGCLYGLAFHTGSATIAAIGRVKLPISIASPAFSDNPCDKVCDGNVVAILAELAEQVKRLKHLDNYLEALRVNITKLDNACIAAEESNRKRKAAMFTGELYSWFRDLIVDSSFTDDEVRGQFRLINKKGKTMLSKYLPGIIDYVVYGEDVIWPKQRDDFQHNYNTIHAHILKKHDIDLRKIFEGIHRRDCILNMEENFLDFPP